MTKVAMIAMTIPAIAPLDILELEWVTVRAVLEGLAGAVPDVVGPVPVDPVLFSAVIETMRCGASVNSAWYTLKLPFS